MSLLSALTPLGMAKELGEYPERLKMATSYAIRNALVLMERHHKKQEIRRNAGKSASVADKWSWRTGALAESYTRYWQRGDLIGYYGSNSIYSRMMEEGGTIRPKHAKFLAIPLKAAKYGVGNGVSPKDRDDLFVIKSGKGNLLLVKAVGAGIVPMFVLKKSVKIDPRRTIERTEKATIKDVDKLMADAALDPFKKGMGLKFK